MIQIISASYAMTFDRSISSNVGNAASLFAECVRETEYSEGFSEHTGVIELGMSGLAMMYFRVPG